MKKWSFGYALLKKYVQLAYWLSHKNITVIGKENIPKNEPIIFAANHQNALMDPIAVNCTSKHQPVWLARADIFKSGMISSILNFMKIMPIFRIRDGKENLGKNDDIFNTAIQVLEAKKALGIFPEAAHSGKRQMLPHKKAIPRIAFLAEEKNNFNLGLKIVPTAIYHNHFWCFKRSVLVNYGTPIDLTDYKEMFINSKHQATMKLKNDIFSAIEKLSLEIKSNDHYEDYELLRELLGKAFNQNGKWHKNKFANQFYSDQKLIAKLETAEKNYPEEFKNLFEQLKHYTDKLKDHDLSDSNIKIGNQSFSSIISKIIIALLLSPFLLAGFCIFLIPFLIPRWYIKSKVKDETFLSTFNFVAGLVTHFLFFTVLAALTFVLSGSILIAFVTLVSAFCVGYIAFIEYKTWKNIGIFIHFQRLQIKHPEKINQIETIRQNCIDKAQHIIDQLHT